MKYALFLLNTLHFRIGQFVSTTVNFIYMFYVYANCINFHFENLDQHKKAFSENSLKINKYIKIKTSPI